MSQVNGHVSEEAATSARLADAPASLTSPPSFTAWPDLYPALSSERQHQILDLARQQGFLLAEQLPPTPARVDRVRPILQDACAGRLTAHPVVEPITPFDAELDDTQRDAVTRAIHSPDLFLIEGPAGTGKSRVALEVIRQVVNTGGKAIVLTPRNVIEDLLSRLKSVSGLTVVRGLAAGESPVADTFIGRDAALRESLGRRAEESVVEAEAELRRAELAGPIWAELKSLIDRLGGLEAERAGIDAKRASLIEAVRHEAETADGGPYFVQRYRGAVTAHAKRIASIEVESAELAKARADMAERRQATDHVVHNLKPKSDAVKSGRWYSLGYWKARGDVTLPTRLADAELALVECDTTLAELDAKIEKVTSDRRLANDELSAEQTRYVDGEVARRQAEFATRANELDALIATDHARIATLRAQVGDSGPDSAAEQVSTARQKLEFCRDWAAHVRSHTEEILADARRTVNVVVGPIGCATGDPHVAAAGPFDLLLVDHAESLTEGEFVPAARLARRWVLVGEPGPMNGGRRERGPRPDLFARLAIGLRHETWGFDERSLVCRLHAVRGADRRSLECEPVADSPEIELRVASHQGDSPFLAEVAFPDDYPPAKAREYLARELDEITCHPPIRVGWWESNGYVLRFGPPDAEAVFAELGNGVREELVGLETRAIHFDAASWAPEQAREWATEHGPRGPGRMASLAKPYRACPGLARWLNDAIACGFAVPAIVDDEPHVEFLAVPDTDQRRRREPRNGRIGGAGYEIDLGDSRQRAALPPEFADLATVGFVNVPEAQSLIRHLEYTSARTISVTSPFPTQVAVLKKLVARSGRLGHVHVAGPDEVPECDLIAVSLTRSHVARAVTFGETPAVLGGLLARARRKVLFAGDPGTLARRLQWEGPVDHLTAAEAARERAWVAALADCPRVTHGRVRPLIAEGARA